MGVVQAPDGAEEPADEDQQDRGGRREPGQQLVADREIRRHLAVVAVLMNAAPFTLYAYGETKVSSVLAGAGGLRRPY